jgi:hypothetical protein
MSQKRKEYNHLRELGIESSDDEIEIVDHDNQFVMDSDSSSDGDESDESEVETISTNVMPIDLISSDEPSDDNESEDNSSDSEAKTKPIQESESEESDQEEKSEDTDDDDDDAGFAMFNNSTNFKQRPPRPRYFTSESVSFLSFLSQVKLAQLKKFSMSLICNN